MSNLSYEILLILTFTVAFLVTYLSIPIIVGVARHVNIFDEPSSRRAHAQNIPALGGVAIFAGFTISAGSFISYSLVPSLQYILVACIIIFFIGIKDDIMTISALKKFAGQIAAAMVLIVPGNLYFSSMHGFMEINFSGIVFSGFYYIPYIAGVALTLFVIILVVNSFNLIDGIDGLAASIGMLASAFFGLWFYISGNIEYCLISVAMFASLLGFFRFNVFGEKNKIFMGDTGSLIVGLMMAVQVIMFNEKNIGFTSALTIKSAPAVSIAVLIIPLFDTLRVFLIRMSRGRSPFSADKNHLHHCLLKLGFSHFQSTLVIVVVNICFIALALLLQNIGIFWLTMVILSIASALTFYVERSVKKNGQNVPAQIKKNRNKSS